DHVPALAQIPEVLVRHPQARRQALQAQTAFADHRIHEQLVRRPRQRPVSYEAKFDIIHRVERKDAPSSRDLGFLQHRPGLVPPLRAEGFIEEQPIEIFDVAEVIATEDPIELKLRYVRLEDTGINEPEGPEVVLFENRQRDLELAQKSIVERQADVRVGQPTSLQLLKPFDRIQTPARPEEPDDS